MKEEKFTLGPEKQMAQRAGWSGGLTVPPLRPSGRGQEMLVKVSEESRKKISQDFYFQTRRFVLKSRKGRCKSGGRAFNFCRNAFWDALVNMSPFTPSRPETHPPVWKAWRRLWLESLTKTQLNSTAAKCVFVYLVDHFLLCPVCWGNTQWSFLSPNKCLLCKPIWGLNFKVGF